jgi:hypothetical protein
VRIAIALLSGQTVVHPRATLSRAAKVVQHAVDNGFYRLNTECVKAASEANAQGTALPEFTEGIDGAI